MRRLATISLALAVTLVSTGASATRVVDEAAVARCTAGLQRSLNVCNNLHMVGSTGWDKCVDYSVSMHRLCVLEAVEDMDTVGN